MAFADELTDLKRKLDARGVSIDAVLQRAGVDRSTWTRWNNGAISSPHFETWSNVKEAADALLMLAPRVRRKAAA